MSPDFLSEHFNLNDVTHSDLALRLGIDNTVGVPWVVATKSATGMEKVRAILNHPIHVNSWFRCLELNRKLGSKDTSQHVKGEAVDFTCKEFGTPMEVAAEIVKNKDLIRFDQLIMEHTWVHISFSANPRGSVLSLTKAGGYVTGLIEGV